MLSLLLVLTSFIDINWDGYDYYRPITSNFLFRPLGWTKPDLTPKYELLGTIVGKDFARGYVRNVRNRRVRIVEIGDVLVDDIAVNEISKGKIQLDDGKEYTIESVGFLNATKKQSRSKRSNVSTKSGDGKTTTEKTETTEKDSGVRQRTNRRGRTGGANWQAQIERFQNASPEERQSMIEQFRQMRGNRGGRRNR